MRMGRRGSLVVPAMTISDDATGGITVVGDDDPNARITLVDNRSYS